MAEADSIVVSNLFQALLDHLWISRDGGVPKTVDQFPKGYTVSYGKLVDLARVPIDPRNAGGYLFHVAERCVVLGWPALHSLAVNKEEGMPGPGFFMAPPRSQRYPATVPDWAADVHACIYFPDFPRKVPTA